MFHDLNLFNADKDSDLLALNEVIYRLSLSLMKVITFPRFAESVHIESL